MAAWTINDQSPTALNLVGGTLTYKSLLPDTLEMTFAADDYAASPFANGAAITAKLDGTTVFKGNVTSVSSATSSSAYTKVIASGPWYWLARSFPVQTSVRPVPPNYDPVSVPVTRFIYDGSKNISQLLTQWISAVSTIASNGTYNIPTVIIPAREFWNETAADLIKYCLGPISRYWAYFDYTKSVPSLNIVHASKSPYANKSIPSDSIIQNDLVDSDESRLARVFLYAEQEGVRYLDPGYDGNPLTVNYVPIRHFSDIYPSSGAAEGTKNVLTKIIKLPGTCTVSVQHIETSSTYTIGQYLTPLDPSLGNHVNSPSFPLYDMLKENGYTPFFQRQSSNVRVTECTLSLVRWESHPNGYTSVPMSWYRLITGRPMDAFLSKAQGDGGFVIAHLTFDIVINGTRYRGRIYVTPVKNINSTYRRVSAGDIVLPSSGVAQALYADKNLPVKTGTVCAVRTWPAPLNNFGGFSIIGPPTSPSVTGIQQASYDLFTDIATFTLGPTPTMSSDDMIRTLRQ